MLSQSSRCTARNGYGGVGVKWNFAERACASVSTIVLEWCQSRFSEDGNKVFWKYSTKQ